VTSTDWATTRDHAIKAFNEIPHANTEHEIVQHFTERPELVQRLINQIADTKDTTNIRSCWAVLRKRLHDPGPTENPTVTSSSNREARVRSAEAWIRNAGSHYDQENEALSELGFTITINVKGNDVEHGNPSGKLYAWRHDTALRDRMAELWRQHRPAGERTEQDATDRADRWKQHRAEALQRARARRAAQTAEAEAEKTPA